MDFVPIKLNPGVDKVRATGIVLAVLDMSKSLKDNGLFTLLHLHFGCPSVAILKAMRDGNVDGFPSHVKIPECFECPICLIAKTKSLVHGQNIPMQVTCKGI